MIRSEDSEPDQVNLDHLRNMHTQLTRMDQSCNKARKVVIETAKDLVLRISEHERRLLNEIETFRQTQCNKCAMTTDQCSTLLQGIHDPTDGTDELYAKQVPSDIRPETPSLQLQMENTYSGYGVLGNSGTDTKENVDRKSGNNDRDKSVNQEGTIGIQYVMFSPVRCNTAFGTIEILKPRTKSLLSCSSQGRSMSMCQNRPLGLTSGTSAPDGTTRPRSRSITAIGNEDFADCQEDEGDTTSDAETSTSSSDNIHSLGLYKEPVLSEQCLWRIDREGSRLGEISRPTDVLFLADGTILVSDKDNFRLQLIDADGTSIKSIAEGLISPRRMTLQQDGLVAITDSRECCVKLVSIDSEVAVNKPNGRKMKQSFNCPCGIAINSKGHFIVSDLDRRNVTCYYKDRKHPKNLLSHEPSDVEFHSPSYLVTDRRDRIIVSDNWCQTVFVFDKAGKLEFEISNTDPEQGRHLKYPNGVCVDDADNIYVADWGNHSVSMFSSDGQFIKLVLTKRNGLSHPAGIAYHKERIAVTEYSEIHSSLALYRINRER
ncbi:hypothetical protein LSH36_9g16032 [Paralvinella palmiformis]|uniref:Tripartite motif-containing protein 2 n=1 Tax=Paralvinella palmiformis TaxID=53620 RepID=A0AAD9KEZ8_9ANNE|nr:hypothetical protein LSH36_9g16032 [Paralvinella palmiformis]